MVAVQPGSRCQSDEELAAASVRACISHGQNTLVIMLQAFTELVFNLIAGAAHTGTGRVAALNHKTVDYTVKNNTVIKAFFYQLDKVFSSQRSLVLKHFGNENTFISRKFNFSVFTH